MLRLFLIALTILPAHGGPQFGALLFGDHSAGLLLVVALFYFGFKWRAK